jgi:VWFA-related protein
MRTSTSRPLGVPVAAAMLVALLSGSGGAQQPPPPPPAGQPPPPAGQQPPPAGNPQQQQPIFRTGINFVRVDVIVTDRQGNPVTDLSEADFEVQEDGKPQKVESFKLVKIDQMSQIEGEPPRPIRSPSDEQAEAGRDDVRLFAIFLDDYHVRLGGSMAIRKPLVAFLEHHVAPADMVAIMYPLTPVKDLVLTRDRDGLIREVQKFEGRKFNYEPRNDFEMQYAYYPASTVERVRNQVSLSALEALVTHMGTLREARKAVILVSEGYSNTLPPQLNDPVAAFPGMNNPARGNPGAGTNDPRMEARDFFENSSLLTDLREVYAAANRANTAIYTLDPRGLAGFEFGINEGVGQEVDRRALQNTTDTLRILADETDGRAIVNRNDFEGGLRQVVKDSSAYYLIGYNSSLAPSDGKFHEISVRVKRPGVQVRARKGYWALTAEETARATAPPREGPPRPVADALAKIAEPPRGRVVRTWIGSTRGENGRTLVTVVWEPIPPLPGERREPEQSPARIALTAVGTQNAATGRPYFRGRVPDVAAAPVPTSAVAGGPESAGAGPRGVTFEAMPGQMEVRVTVENASGRTLDTEVRELAVPDFTSVDLRISTPRILAARTPRELQALKADPSAMPSADREFSRTERLVIRFEAFAPGDLAPQTTARLLNRQGTSMRDLTVQPPAAGSATHNIDLPLAGLAPGDYLVEITARTEAGTVQELIAFKVTS